MSQPLFFSESQTNLFVYSRNLTGIYRNLTFIRTYFVVVLQQHNSSEATQTERVGVGEAPNYFLILIQLHLLII